MPDTPVEERLQNREVLVGGAARYLLSALQLEILDRLGTDLREMGLRPEVRLPERERRVNVTLVRAVLHARVFAVLPERFSERDVSRRALVPGAVLNFRLLGGPHPQGGPFAPKAFAKSRPVRITNLNEPATGRRVPHWPLREVAIL